MTPFKALIIGLCMLAVSACAGLSGGDGKIPLGSLGQQVADAIVNVSDENRDLRVCWLAAGGVEVLTDLAQRAGGDEAVRALGHLVLLQGAIDKARMSDPFWIETDTADVALLFAAVLKDVDKSRLSQILLGGPTVTNFLNVAKRIVVLTVKGHAVMKDINRVLTAVEAGEVQKADAWKACEDRTAMNRNALRALTGGATLSSTETMSPMLSYWEERSGIDGGTNEGVDPELLTGVAPNIGWPKVPSPAYQPIFRGWPPGIGGSQEMGGTREGIWDWVVQGDTGPYHGTQTVMGSGTEGGGSDQVGGDGLGGDWEDGWLYVGIEGDGNPGFIGINWDMQLAEYDFITPEQWGDSGNALAAARKAAFQRSVIRRFKEIDQELRQAGGTDWGKPIT